jgi:DNA-binding NtrC family response regulator
MVSETGSKPGRGARRTAALVVLSRAVPREVRGSLAGILEQSPRIGRVIVTPFALVERCTSLIRDELASAVVRLAVDAPQEATTARESEDDLRRARLAFENAHVRRVLERHGGDKARAAQALGIDISSLYRRLQQIERER